MGDKKDYKWPVNTIANLARALNLENLDDLNTELAQRDSRIEELLEQIEENKATDGLVKELQKTLVMKKRVEDSLLKQLGTSDEKITELEDKLDKIALDRQVLEEQNLENQDPLTTEKLETELQEKTNKIKRLMDREGEFRAIIQKLKKRQLEEPTVEVTPGPSAGTNTSLDPRKRTIVPVSVTRIDRIDKILVDLDKRVTNMALEGAHNVTYPDLVDANIMTLLTTTDKTPKTVRNVRMACKTVLGQAMVECLGKHGNLKNRRRKIKIVLELWTHFFSRTPDPIFWQTWTKMARLLKRNGETEIQRIHADADAREMNWVMIRMTRMLRDPTELTIENIVKLILPTLPLIDSIFGKDSIVMTDALLLLRKILKTPQSNEKMVEILLNWLPAEKQDRIREPQLLDIRKSDSLTFTDWRSRNVRIVNWNTFKWLGLYTTPTDIAAELERRFAFTGPSQNHQTDGYATNVQIDEYEPTTQAEPEKTFEYAETVHQHTDDQPSTSATSNIKYDLVENYYDNLYTKEDEGPELEVDCEGQWQTDAYQSIIQEMKNEINQAKHKKRKLN